MATNTQLKFYKLGANASMPANGLVKGAIYFVPKEGVIRVATSDTTSEPYGGKLQNAEWDSNKLKLTITKYDGSSLQLDFSDMASSSAVTAELNKLSGKANSIAAAVGLTADGDNFKFAKNAANYGGAAETIGDEIKNVDAAIKNIADTVATMATSEAVTNLQNRMTTAEGEIDVLQAATTGYDADNTISAAIAAAKAEAKTEVKHSDNDFSAKHLTVTTATPANQDGHVTYVVEVKDLVDSSVYTQDQSAVSERIAGVEGEVDTLQGQVAALSSATHFVGKFDTLDLALAEINNKGDIVIVGEKEYIYNANVVEGVSKDKSNFVELGDTTAAMEEITKVSNRVTPLESWKEEMTKADGTLAGINAAIGNKLATETYNTFKTGDYDVFKSETNAALTAIDSQFDKVDGITGFDSDAVNKANYNIDGITYIKDETTLKDADIALDSAVKAIADRVTVVEGEVAEVVGNNSTISVSTDANGKATISAITNTLEEALDAKNNSTTVNGLATAQDVLAALCWQEFN